MAIHEPNLSCLVRSTMVSQAIGSASIALEECNLAFEQMLLREMCGSASSTAKFLARIQNLRSCLRDIYAMIGALRKQMKEEDYIDLPTITSPDLDDAGLRMATHGLVSLPYFRWVLANYRDGTFYAVLHNFETKLNDVVGLNEQLYTRAELSHVAALNAKLQSDLQENGPGNPRAELARLRMAWYQLNRYWMAATLIGTEAFYMAHGHGSMVPFEEPADTVA